MRVVRGSLSNVENDRRVTEQLTRLTKRTEEPTLRVWTPPRQIAFGRRDSTVEGYQRARRVATEHGYEPFERSVGGRAVAYTGSTVAFAFAVPTDDERGGIETRYRETTSRLIRSLEAVGAVVSRGEPDRSFCPGEHSIQGTGKIVGIAQRVQRDSALIGGCVIALTADEEAISNVLGPVYDALNAPFDPSSVGSVEGAGGVADVGPVIEAIEAGFIEDREITVLSAETLFSERAP
jgi:octanoyl-[GcvH]:protein N-octanoyltransferase